MLFMPTDDRTAGGRVTHSALSAFRDAILSGRYQFTQHARDRMERCRVSQGDFLDCVQNGDFSVTRRHVGTVGGAYYRKGLFVVVAAPSVPGTNFYTLEPVIVTVCRSADEEAIDDIPIVPHERIVERPLEQHSIEELQAALDRRRDAERRQEMETLARRQAETDQRMAQLSAELESLNSQRQQIEARLQALA